MNERDHARVVEESCRQPGAYDERGERERETEMSEREVEEREASRGDEAGRGRTSMAYSAVLLEAGILVLAIGLVGNSAAALPGAILVLAGLGSFLAHVRDIVKRKLPPPAALPRRDWATWQTHVAFGWLLLAAITGLVLTLPVPLAWTVPLAWIYGAAGLLGFLAQVVVGIQGRLLPLHGWYRVFVTEGMRPPQRSAHSLASHRLSRWILLTWTFGIPLLAGGLAFTLSPLVRIGSAVLLAGVVLNAAQATVIATAEAAATPPSCGSAR